MSPYRNRLIATDAVMIVVAIGIGLLISSRASEWAIDPTLAIYGSPAAIGLLWIALLVVRGSYDRRILGLGSEEVRRAVSATLALFAIVAGLSYLIRADISRAYAFISLPLGLLLIGFARVWMAPMALPRAQAREILIKNNRDWASTNQPSPCRQTESRKLRGIPSD